MRMAAVANMPEKIVGEVISTLVARELNIMITIVHAEIIILSPYLCSNWLSSCMVCYFGLFPLIAINWIT